MAFFNSALFSAGPLPPLLSTGGDARGFSAAGDGAVAALAADPDDGSGVVVAAAGGALFEAFSAGRASVSALLPPFGALGDGRTAVADGGSCETAAGEALSMTAFPLPGEVEERCHTETAETTAAMAATAPSDAATLMRGRVDGAAGALANGARAVVASTLPAVSDTACAAVNGVATRGIA